MIRSGRRFFLLLALLALPTPALGTLPKGLPTDPDVAASALGLASSPDGQWLVHAPPYVVRPVVGEDSQLYEVVDVSGWPKMATPGLPAIPYTTTLVVLPATGSVRLDFDVAGESFYPLHSAIRPASEPVPQNAVDGSSQLSTAWALDPSIYSGDAVFPPEPVTFTEIGILRGLRLGRLTVYPFRYDPSGQRLVVLDEVSVRLQFEESFSQGSEASTALDSFHASLRPFVLNSQALWVDTVAKIPSATGAIGALPASSQLVQFSVEEAGLYSVSWQTLTDAGIVPVDGDPSLVHIWRAATGTEIAPAWEPDQQKFVFYAQPIASRWADHEVYRVSYDDGLGLRMASRACQSTRPYQVYLPFVIATQGEDHASPYANIWVEVSAEENHLYDSLYVSSRDGQPWYWACLQKPRSSACPTEMSHTVTLSLPSETGEAELELSVQGYTRTEHRIQVSINGLPVGIATWMGKQPFVARFRFPAYYLRDGDNLVQLERLGDGIGGAWIDAFELRHDIAMVGELPLRFTGQAGPSTYYLRGVETDAVIYEITDPDVPALVTGCDRRNRELRVADDRDGPLTYLLAGPSDVREISDLRPLNVFADPAGADYIAIAPQAWLDALQPLLAYRESQGLSTFAAPLEAIYDLYGDGRQDPESIRAFISDAYHTWVPQPLYVLLVGDGTWDPLNYMGTDTPTWLPPYLVSVDPWMGEVPADNRYAAVDGNDVLPDLAVGRLPVNSAEGLADTIAKILTYEHDADVSLWKLRHLLVVDNSDGANDFSGSAALIAPLAPPTHTVVSLEMPGPDVDTLFPQRESLFSHLRQGALVVSWIGHSSWQQWEHRRLFHTDDRPMLSQEGRLPLILEMTCFTSNFANPEPQHTALDEALVRLPEAGAVATWGSSGGGLDAAHQILHTGFYRALFGSDLLSIGEASLAAKLTVPADALHLVDTFHLFGDPALSLHRSASPYIAYLPLVHRVGRTIVFLPVVSR